MPPAWPVTWSMITNTQCTWHWQVFDMTQVFCLWRKLMSICEHKRAPVEHIILIIQGGPTGMPKAWPRDAVSRSHSQGTMVTYVTWDVPFPKGTLHCVLFRGSLWERYANAAMLREKCPKAGFLSHRLEEHHPCSAELGSKRKTLLQASSKLAIID